MSRKPTYDQLERRVQELEHETNKRKLAEEALQHSEQWFRTIVNVLPQFVSYVDKDLRYRFVNQTYQEAFGLAPEDIVGKTLPEVIGRVAFEEARTHVAKALAGEAVRYHQRYQYATGGTRDIDGRLIPDRDEQGLVQGYYAVLTDITPYVKVQEELKESEHKYRNLVNNFPGITYQFVMTAQGDIYFDCIGDQCSDMLGLSSQEIMADAEIIFKRIPEPDADKVRRAILESADALTPYEVEHRIVKPDGQINWVHASSVPRKLANGDIIWDGIGVDVTDRKLAEEALKRSYQELELRNHVAALFLTSPKDRLYHDILNLLLQEFDSQYGYVGYIDENGDLVCPSMTQDIWSKCRVQGKSIVFPRHSWRGIWGTSLQERRAMMRNDGLKPPDGHVTLHNALIVPL
ncbi:MAG: PAS domain S-box protein, partial [Desulfohalobiaceae bacterium]|nr:PAS domain S-box protein [Desulfohalobiaceae bacterium]